MKRALYACLLALFTASCPHLALAQLANSCWPKFHKDYLNSGQGIYGGIGSDLTWTYTAAGPIKSAPVVGADGTTYFACDDGKLYAIAGDGTKLWDYYCNCQGSPSPAVASDGTIYVGSLDRYFYAINHSGTLKWKKAITAKIESSIAIGSDGILYFGCASNVIAYRPDGTQKWAFATGGTVTSTPSIGTDGTIYVGSMDGGIYAINATGTQKWKFTATGSGGFAVAPSIGSDGTVYIGSVGGYVYAVRNTGTQKWRANAGGEVRSSAAVATGGNIHYGCRDNKLHTLSSTGASLWTYTTGHYVDSSPAVGSDGGIYVGSLDGRLYAFNPDGTERWHYDTGSSIASSPAIGPAGALLLGADNGVLYCFTADNTPPISAVVTDDGAYTSVLDRLHGSWTAVDPESGIFSYEYCIGTAPGLADVAPWLNVGSASQHTRTGLALVDTQTYYITVRAINGAGLKGAEASSDGIIADATPPTIPTVADTGRFTPDATSLHASWSAVDPESGIAGYQYAIGTSAGASNVVAWTDAGTSTEVTKTGMSLQSGLTYYFSVKALNGGGVYGPVGSSDGITVDTSPPATPAVIDSGRYFSNPSTIHASWTSSDNESGVTRFEYSVGTSAGGTSVHNWTDAGTAPQLDITGLTLTNGETYYVNCRATNGAGVVSSVGSSDGITLDVTPPSTPTVTDDGNYTIDPTRLHVVWSAVDPQSGIARYEYSVGTAAGATDLAGWTSAGTVTDYVIAGLALQSGTRYYINVRAVNGAVSYGPVGSSDGIYVESTPPTTPVVTDDGAYTSSTTTLHASWATQDPETGVAGCQYSIGTTPGGTNTVGWTPIGTATGFTRTDLSLTQGQTYYVNVKATNGIGLVSDVGSSDGIKVDTTPPGKTTVTRDGAFTVNTDRLHVTMACDDAESGIASYRCAVGTTPGGTDVQDWTDWGPGPDVTITDLTLSNAVTYYVAAKAVNGAGLVGEAGLSEGITVDTTPPEGVRVWDDGQYTAEAGSLHGRWTANDAESGIASYRYCIGTAAGLNDVADWLDAGAATSDTRNSLSLVSGQSYYITVIARNGAGGESAPASSDGIMLDLTPPTRPTVDDTGTYWGYRTSIYAQWSSSDPESGIAEYQMSVGTSPGSTDVADWLSVATSTSLTRAGLSLSNGITYYVNVKARNGANAWSEVGSSDGVLIDSTPPTPPVVTDDGDYTSVLDRLHATWHSTDPESGIAEYTYCIGTSPGATDVAPWTSAGLSEEKTVTGLSLEPMLKYYFSVKARSHAGAWSAAGASDGIAYNTGPAIWGKFRNDAANRGRGLFNATTVNELAWQVPTQGYVESSPAIAADGTSYTGSADGNLYAITQNGTLRWKFTAGGPIESSPAIAQDGNVVFGSDDGKVYCLAPTGDVAWTCNTGGPVRSSPAIADATAYVGCADWKLYAIDVATGACKWAYTTGGALKSSPAVSGDKTIYVGAGDGYIYAINPDGTRKWRFLTGSAVDASPAVADDGTVYIGSGDGYLYALNPNGTQKWRFGTGTLADSSPAISPDGTIYFGAGLDGGNGKLFALRPDKSVIWQVNLTGGGVVSSPAIDPAGNIYVGACDGKLYAFAPTGTKLWSYTTGSSVTSSPALGGDSSVVVGSYDGSIYCFRDASSKDLTPPTTPVVTVPSTQLAAGADLVPSWSASDPESMVAEYTYAVGTGTAAPDNANVVGWTSAGIDKSIAIDGMLLEVGQTCYVSVKARNPSQRWSDVGVSEGVTITNMGVVGRSGDVQGMRDGFVASLKGKVVTAIFPECFYVEEPNRCSGVRCNRRNADVHPGDWVDVAGTVKTIDGRKLLDNAEYSFTRWDTPLGPLGISGMAVRSAAPAVFGIYVRFCGRLTACGPDYVVLDDGTGMESARPAAGLEVRTASGTAKAGDYCSATGAIWPELVEGRIVPVLRPAAGGFVILAPK